MASPFLIANKPTLSKSQGTVVKGSNINLLGNMPAGNYTIITNPVKTSSGKIIDAADTQTISYSASMKEAAQELAKTGNPLEKAAANFYLFMDDPNKRGSAKYYENQLKKLGLDITEKSNTGNGARDFALDVVKGFVGSPAQTARVIASGSLGATLLAKDQDKAKTIKGGAQNAVTATVQGITDSPGMFVGGALAGVAGTKGIGILTKKPSIPATIKTGDFKQTSASGGKIIQNKKIVNKPSLEKAVKKTQRKQKIKKSLDKVKPKVIVTLPETKPSLEKAVKRESRKQNIKKNLRKATPKVIVTVPSTKSLKGKTLNARRPKPKRTTSKPIKSNNTPAPKKTNTASSKKAGYRGDSYIKIDNRNGTVGLVKPKKEQTSAKGKPADAKTKAKSEKPKGRVNQQAAKPVQATSKTAPLTTAPAAVLQAQKQEILTLTKAGSGKTVTPKPKPPVIVPSKVTIQKPTQTPNQEGGGKTKTKTRVLPAQKPDGKSKQQKIKHTPKSGTPKTKTKKTSRLRLKEEEKKKKKRVVKVKDDGALRLETVNQFGWLGIDKKPAAKPRKIK